MSVVERLLNHYKLAWMNHAHKRGVVMKNSRRERSERRLEPPVKFSGSATDVKSLLEDYEAAVIAEQSGTLCNVNIATTPSGMPYCLCCSIPET